MAITLINPVRHPLLHFVSQTARWVNQDSYPSHLACADEHERWLEFIDSKRALARFLPRLRDRANQRDEALAEISVSYFLEKLCGLVIVAWEPPGANGKTGEYLVGLPDGREMFVEVKARGWEDEIVWIESHNSPRLLQPKYIDGEFHPTAPWRSVREAVKKAYAKMTDTMPTLLVICNDVFLKLNDTPENVDIALYCPRGRGVHTDPGDYLSEDGYFVTTRLEDLGAVATMNVDFPSPLFRFSVYDNLNCIQSVAVPHTIFSGHPRTDRMQL
jgi:hypothetical protein